MKLNELVKTKRFRYYYLIALIRIKISAWLYKLSEKLK